MGGACSASTQKAMVWASHVQDQPEQDNKILSQQTKQQQKKIPLFNSRTLQIQKQHKKMRLKCQFTELSSLCQACYIQFPVTSPAHSKGGLIGRGTETQRLTVTAACPTFHRDEPSPLQSDFKRHARSSKLSSEGGENSKKPTSLAQIAILIHVRQCRQMYRSTILSSTVSPASSPNQGIFKTAERSRQPHKDPNSSSWPFPLTGFLSRDSVNLNWQYLGGKISRKFQIKFVTLPPRLDLQEWCVGTACSSGHLSTGPRSPPAFTARPLSTFFAWFWTGRR